MTRSDTGSASSLPGFRHALEAAVVFGTVGGLADVSYLVSRFPDLASELFPVLRFLHAAAFLTALAFLPYLLLVLLVIRPIAKLRRWELGVSLTVIYFLGILPAGAILSRNVALLVASESILVQQVKTVYYFLKYLWLLVPLSWAIGLWLARLRTSLEFPVLFGRLSAFAFAAAFFLILTPMWQQNRLLARANIYSEVASGGENTVISLAVFVAAVVLLLLASWIAVRLARSARGAFLWLIWAIALLVPFVPPLISGPGTVGTPPSGAPLSGRAANVMLVSLDTTRYDDLGFNGSEIVATPTLDAIAETGAVFDNAIVPMPITGPSHTSMLTGLQPDARVGHGVKSNGVRLSGEIPTLATILDVAGYRTGAVISGFPLARQACGLERGFHYYHDIFNPSLRGRFLPDQVWYLTVSRILRKVFNIRAGLPHGATKAADAVTDQTLEWLEGNADQPFFMFVHYFDPHYLYAPPPPFNTMYMPDYDGPYEGQALRYSGLVQEIPGFTEDDFAYYRASYRGEISSMDRELGRIIEWGEERGLWENTLLIVVSDHGESFEHEYYFNHTDRVYEQLIHVPLIVRDPDAVAQGIQGGRADTLVNVSDLFFTVLSFLQVDPPRPAREFHEGVLGSREGWDHDLLPLIHGDERDEAGWGFIPSQTFSFAVSEELSVGRFFSFRFPDWHIIYGPDAEPYLPEYQCFDLSDDPDEMVDLYPEMDWEAGPWAMVPGALAGWALEQAAIDVASMDPQVRAQLEALGYL